MSLSFRPGAKVILDGQAVTITVMDWINSNCTQCLFFGGNLKLKTDDVFPLMNFEQQAFYDCAKYAGQVSNPLLCVCYYFQYDSTKPRIVELEKHHKPEVRYFVRSVLPEEITKPEAPIIGISDIDRIIYNFVVDALQVDIKGAPFTFIIKRLHKDRGYSEIGLFKAVMSMIDRRLLEKKEYHDIRGVVFVQTPTFILTIQEVKNYYHARAEPCQA